MFKMMVDDNGGTFVDIDGQWIAFDTLIDMYRDIKMLPGCYLDIKKEHYRQQNNDSRED